MATFAAGNAIRRWDLVKVVMLDGEILALKEPTYGVRYESYLMCLLHLETGSCAGFREIAL